MTTPGGSAPDGAYVVGSRYGQDETADGVNAKIRGKALGGFQNAQSGFHGGFLGGLIGALTQGLHFNLGGLSTWGGGVVAGIEETKASLEFEVPRLDNRIDKLANGDSVYLYTSSGGTFTKPTGAKRIGVAVIGGGDGGFGGSKGAFTPWANGGTNGSYLFKWFDAAEVPASVSVTLGTPGTGGPGRPSGLGNGGTFQAGGQGTTTRFGTLLTSVENGIGAILAEEGILSAALSAPGSGGHGGIEDAPAGAPGGSTGWKSGGAGSSTGQGGTGQSITTTNDPFSGGGGGGGGGGTSTGGFRGGNGGWPGGGGGGGGSTNSTISYVSGAGGNGAAGAVRIIVKYT